MIESWWGARFSAPALGGSVDHPTSDTMGNGSFPGVERPERGVDRSLPSSAEVKERVDLYLYSTYGPLWPCYRVKFNLYLKNQVTPQRPICLYDLFSRTVSMRKAMSKRTFFCFNAAADTLREKLRTFYCCRRHKFATKALLFKTKYLYVFDSDL